MSKNKGKNMETTIVDWLKKENREDILYSLALSYYQECNYKMTISLINHAGQDKNLSLNIRYKLLELGSWAYMAEGDLKKAWEYHAFRDHLKNAKNKLYEVQCIQWTGTANILNKKLLILAEGCRSDELLYNSQLHLILRLAAEIYLQCDRDLKSLFRMAFPTPKLTIFESGCGRCLTKFAKKADFWCMSGDLAPFINQDLEILPKRLKIEPSMVFNALIHKYSTQFKNKKIIGVAYKVDESLPLDFWIDLLNSCSEKETVFVNLQENHLTPLEFRGMLFDHPKMIKIEGIRFHNDFISLFSLVRKMDYILSVDGVIAHLAGRAACAGAVILQKACDCRWLAQTQDNHSLWHPTIKIARNPSFNKYDHFLLEIVANLKSHIGVRE